VIETELGRALDGTRRGDASHITQSRDGAAHDPMLRAEVLDRLHSMGIDTGLFASPSADPAAAASNVPLTSTTSP
jgi:hypothetical protein